jgi:hypothetical protein
MKRILFALMMIGLVGGMQACSMKGEGCASGCSDCDMSKCKGNCKDHKQCAKKKMKKSTKAATTTPATAPATK